MRHQTVSACLSPPHGPAATTDAWGTKALQTAIIAGQLLLALTIGIPIHLMAVYLGSIIAGQLLLAVTSGILITRHLTVGYCDAIMAGHSCWLLPVGYH
ncbi:hypothetical protein DPMN_083673 [Dreissena polymorpha]|uniref:Uncharacterized protein n=1 Tax=Dreissena polymorpha TaxID=45954 RepID=A0A9D3Y978_DREPO|nr:hypothetical protein DPMN_083673 [Dreissena polymorpha]